MIYFIFGSITIMELI